MLFRRIIKPSPLYFICILWRHSMLIFFFLMSILSIIKLILLLFISYLRVFWWLVTINLPDAECHKITHRSGETQNFVWPPPPNTNARPWRNLVLGTFDWFSIIWPVFRLVFYRATAWEDLLNSRNIDLNQLSAVIAVHFKQLRVGFSTCFFKLGEIGPCSYADIRRLVWSVL